MPEEENIDNKQEYAGFDTKLEPAKYSLLGEILSDRYIVIDAIGEGALSIVYLGQCMETQDSVAIKTLKFKNPELEARFIEQSNIFKELNHPNIIEILDVFTHTNGQPVVIMKYIEGITLTKLMESAGRIEEENTLLSIITGVCDALEYSHMKSHYHGGLTPNQLLVSETSDSDDLKVTVTDFSTSYLTYLFRKNENDPKSDYLSPEQKNNEYVAFNTDVFSLGTVVYELVSGKKPFATKKLSALVEGKSSAGPTFTPITHMALKLSGLAALNQILESSLDNDPDWRMPSISQFRKEMQDWHAKAINELGTSSYTDLSQFDDIDFEDLEVDSTDAGVEEEPQIVKEEETEPPDQPDSTQETPIQDLEEKEVSREKDQVTNALLSKINKAKEAKQNKVRSRPKSARKNVKPSVRSRRESAENKAVIPPAAKKSSKIVFVLIATLLVVAVAGGIVALNFSAVKNIQPPPPQKKELEQKAEEINLNEPDTQKSPEETDKTEKNESPKHTEPDTAGKDKSESSQ